MSAVRDVTLNIGEATLIFALLAPIERRAYLLKHVALQRRLVKHAKAHMRQALQLGRLRLDRHGGDRSSVDRHRVIVYTQRISNKAWPCTRESAPRSRRLRLNRRGLRATISSVGADPPEDDAPPSASPMMWAT